MPRHKAASACLLSCISLVKQHHPEHKPTRHLHRSAPGFIVKPLLITIIRTHLAKPQWAKSGLCKSCAPFYGWANCSSSFNLDSQTVSQFGGQIGEFFTDTGLQIHIHNFVIPCWSEAALTRFKFVSDFALAASSLKMKTGKNIPASLADRQVQGASSLSSMSSLSQWFSASSIGSTI